MGIESLPPTAFAAIGALLVANFLIYKFVLKKSEKKVREFMTTPVVTLAPEATVNEASKLMADKKISCVVVEKDSKPEGIITEKDILDLFAKKACTEETPLEDVMSKPVEFAGSDSNIDYVAKMMITNNIRHIPIIGGGKLVGMVAESDILRQDAKLIARVRKNIGWDYIEPRVAEEIKELLDKNAGKSWDDILKQFPKWMDFIEDRNMVRDGERKKVLMHLKKAYDKR